MFHDASDSSNEPWFAVRCLFSHPTRVKDAEQFLYEERITLWKTGSVHEAFRLAEKDAEKYAKESKSIFIRATDSFHLFDESVGHSTEVWSVMRGSGMEAELYADTFCDTPCDRKQPLDED